jgi:predicted nucleic acid-binding protein
VSELVLDCSVAIAWLFEDEAAAETDVLLDRTAREGAAVPALSHYEVANVLLQAERQKRLVPGRVPALLQRLARLPIETHAAPRGLDWAGLIGLAADPRLTAYDASYLALAERLALPLATRDRALRDAAVSRGVAVLP